MRILVLNHEFPPVGGGGGRACADLARALARRGHDVRILTAGAPGLPDRENVNGCEVIRLATGRRSRTRAGLPDMLRYVAASAVAGTRHVRRWKPAVLHAHFAVPAGAAAWFVHRVTGIPYVLTAHLGDVPGGVPEKTGGWFRWIQPWTPSIWRSAAAVVAVSQHTRALALQHYQVPVQVIPNGVDLARWKPASLEPGHPPRLIFAGRFQPQKNVPGLVSLLHRLRDIPWTCEILGDGTERPEVEERIRGFGLQDRIRLPGWIDSAAVDARLGASDVLVLPSRQEGLPVVGVQALAAGLAIVGSRVGGLTELIEDGVNGRSCEPEHSECFVEALRWCLADRARLKELRRASLRKADAYDLEQVASAYEQVFAAAVGSR